MELEVLDVMCAAVANEDLCSPSKSLLTTSLLVAIRERKHLWKFPLVDL